MDDEDEDLGRSVAIGAVNLESYPTPETVNFQRDACDEMHAVILPSAKVSAMSSSSFSAAAIGGMASSSRGAFWTAGGSVQHRPHQPSDNITRPIIHIDDESTD